MQFPGLPDQKPDQNTGKLYSPAMLEHRVHQAEMIIYRVKPVALFIGVLVAWVGLSQDHQQGALLALELILFCLGKETDL